MSIKRRQIGKIGEIREVANNVACRRMNFKLRPSQPSIVVNFNNGRLGNKLCAFASAYALWKDYGMYNYITPYQYIHFGKVFQFPHLREDKEHYSYYLWRQGRLSASFPK